MTVHVRTGSRLHFGLLGPPAPHGRRDYGGVGLMIESPGLVLSVSRAAAWSADGPLAERALALGQRFAAAEGLGAYRVQIESAAALHAGLGTGTQLALAVVQAMQAGAGRKPLATADLARGAGRGLRSGLGVHGFVHGGLLVDGGKTGRSDLAPLVARHQFPPTWPVVLVLPSWGPGLHGEAEMLAFERLRRDGSAGRAADGLCRILVLEMLPALVEQDVDAFGEAVFEYNRRVGELFASVQGGPYASPRVAELIAFLRGLGARGVGQSSWGPGVFAVLGNEEQANELARCTRRRFGLRDEEILLTRAMNSGAIIETN